MSKLLIPVAISSQLDVSGEERIHAATYTPTTRVNFMASITLVPNAPPGQLMRTVLCMAWSADGRYLFTGGEAYNAPYFPRLCIWERTPGTTTFTLRTSPSPDCSQLPIGMSLSSDGGYLAVTENVSGQFEIFTVAGGALTKTQTLSTGVGIGGYDSVSFSPNADYLAVLSSQGNTGTLIYKRTGSTFALLTQILGGGFSCKFSPDGNYLLTTVVAGHRIFHRVGDTFTDVTPVGFALATFAPNRVVFSADGTVMIALNGQSVYIYSVSNGVFTLTQTINPYSVSLSDLAISNDGNNFVVTAQSSVKPEITLFSRSAGVYSKVTASIAQSTDITDGVLFSPQNDLVAIGGSWGINPNWDSLHFYKYP